VADELEFFYSDVQREIEAIKGMSRRFIERGTERVFDALRSQLDELRDHGGSTNWHIPKDQPLRTIVSSGGYERSGAGLAVRGSLTSTWSISHVPGKGKARFALTGNASTVVRIEAAEDEQELAMWRMEVGARDAPGACFHAQMLGETDSPPFPKALSVPRLPIFLATPLAALDFVLGELFQIEWPSVAAEASTQTSLWRSVQATRWRRTLDWQLKLVGDAVGSPWLSVKRGFPEADLFTADSA
jgi:hypothetical protein